MSFTVTKNGVGIMLGIYGNEFWRANGGVKYAFFPRSRLMRRRVCIVELRRLMTFYTVHGMIAYASELFIIWNMAFWHAMILF